jgi:hypothetical protein
MRIGKTAIPSQGNKRMVMDAYLSFILHNNRQMTKRELADSIGIGESGSLNQKIGDLKKFGLLKGQEDNLRLTDLAIQLYTTKDPALLVQSIKHIPFYGYLLGKYNSTPITREIILKELTEIAKLKPGEANLVADKVHKLYHESADFVFSKPNLEELFKSIKVVRKIELPPKEEPTPEPSNESKPPVHTEMPKPRLVLHAPTVEPILKNERDGEKPMEKKFSLFITYGDTPIPLVTASAISLARKLINEQERDIQMTSKESESHMDQ